MGIFLKGFKTNRSLSPVMMQAAPASTANSRNLLSLGSRQASMLTVTGIKCVMSLKSCITVNRFVKDKYLSNFGRTNTSETLQK